MREFANSWSARSNRLRYVGTLGHCKNKYIINAGKNKKLRIVVFLSVNQAQILDDNLALLNILREAKVFELADVLVKLHPRDTKNYNEYLPYIKIIKEPWKATLDKVTVAAIVKEAHRQKRKAVVHVSKVKDGYEVLKDKADGLVHVWDDKPLNNEQLNELKKEHFFVIPTILTLQKVQSVYFQKTKEETEVKVKMIKNEVKRLYDIGVPILAGTDPPNANINYGTDLYKEMILLNEAGISTIDVLKSATSLPATHFNLKNKGFIKKGYRADLILVDGNPTENIKDIANNKRVFKLGKEVK